MLGEFPPRSVMGLGVLITLLVTQIDGEAEDPAVKKSKGKAIDVGSIYEDDDMVSLSVNSPVHALIGSDTFGI